ncbi:hypothetical protein FQA47_003781 [Oryzias melastigma]|uniref:Uncharacterized protein n=1 Tax=Oryzias melastigma TaxID=30732 RepID=A0A834FDE7_ORYME|nr:hypothetical protein FQA47_003781 [Oryzias melastigma]
MTHKGTLSLIVQMQFAVASQPASQPSDATDLTSSSSLPLLSTVVGTQTQHQRPPLIFHSPSMLQDRQHTPTQYMQTQMCHARTRLCSVSTHTQKYSTLVRRSHWPAQFLVIVVKSEKEKGRT